MLDCCLCVTRADGMFRAQLDKKSPTIGSLEPAANCCIFVQVKTLHMYKWRTKWLGKWGTTRYRATEEEMRKRDPTAIRLDDTLEIVHAPDTEEELAAIGSLHSRIAKGG